MSSLFLYPLSVFLMETSLDKICFCVILNGMDKLLSMIFYKKNMRNNRKEVLAMSKTYIPEGYHSELTLYETQNAIGVIHHAFEEHLGQTLNLKRVSAPLFVDPYTGLNDNLSGVERPVSFEIPATGTTAEVVHSLAKWKRMALYRYDFRPGKGLYTNMNAIRRDETLDNLHSIYVDQWDWERVMPSHSRNTEYLKKIVNRIYNAILRTEFFICETYPQLKAFLPEDIHFIHAEELRQRYPDLTPKEREDAICREYGAVFIIGIGGKLGDGKEHDLRAPDYDDYSTTDERTGLAGLNGDLLIWYPILDRAIELSSMGIRVDQEALLRQLQLSGKEDRKNLYFHRRLLDGTLPQSIGGGIGQSRLCMVLLHKAHVGETQSSIWPEEMRRECKEAGMILI